MSDQLARRLNLPDAVVIGVAAMIGAGVFAAWGPAAAAAGPWLLIGLILAAAVAYANATSTASLAARMPTSGGIYAFAGALISPLWGQLAGWAFLVGKAASCAVMALTFGTYVYEPMARPLAVALVIAVTVVNHFGITKTAAATRWILAVTLVTLAAVVISGLSTTSEIGSSADAQVNPVGVLESAGILFFAFAGYARLATLGEEVRDPERTIPRAVRAALAIALAVYLLVALAGLHAIGWQGLAGSPAPLADVVRAGPFAGAAAIVTVGAAVATAGVLLSLTAGMGRTAFAMARHGDLPSQLAQVGQRHQVPQVAGWVIAVVVTALVLITDLRGAIGVSAFAVLTYYAIGHVAAWRLGDSATRATKIVAASGLTGCVVLAFTLPVSAVVAALALLAIGLVVFAARRRREP